MSDASGITLLESVVVLTLALLAMAAAIPALAAYRASALAAVGARHLVASLHAQRWNSVASGRAHGLLFVREASGWSWFEVRDENGNGLRSRELQRGVDRTLGGPHRLEDVVPGVTLGIPDGREIPDLPPRSGTLHGGDDPIRIGGTDLLSFGPLGTASGGTLFLTDRHTQLYAVVIYGRTAKIRVWRFSMESGQWSS